MPSFLIYLHSSFCLGCRAQTSCYTRDGNCHIGRQTPNHSLTHIPDTPALKARVKQRIILVSVSTSLQLSPRGAAVFPLSFAFSHLFMLHFLTALTNYYTPFSVLLHLLPSPITASVTVFSLALAFPDCHNSSSFPSFNHHKSFPPLLCLASPHQQLCQGPKLPEPAEFMTNLYKHSKNVVVYKPFVTVYGCFISHQAYI